MVHLSRFAFKAAVLILILAIQSGCSSSQLESSDVTPETLDQVTVEAGTDNIPQPASDALSPAASDPAAPAALDANASFPPPVEGAPMPSDPAAAPSAPAESSLAESTLANTELSPPAGADAGALASPISSDPAPMAPVSGEQVQYKVKRGDTLMKIAFEKYGDLNRWKEILSSNASVLTDGQSLRAGMVLTIDGASAVAVEHQGEIYLIQRGDTLGLISGNVYGTPSKWKRLWDNNRDLIKNPNRIYAGFNLYYIPESKLTEDGSASDASASNQQLPFKNKSKKSGVAKRSGKGSKRQPSSLK